MHAAAPNLTITIYNQIGRSELYLAAVFGFAVQLGVLIHVYDGLAIRFLWLLRDGNPVAEYAFPCTLSGTLPPVVGTLLCGHVVERATPETRYCPAAESVARVIWLQRSATVNDQAFKPFAMFPQSTQALITTSHRTGTGGKRRELDRAAHGIRAKFPESLTTAGVLLGICGFIVQFTDLRGMHWSASVAQLGAIMVMASLRAWLRRNLAEKPEAIPLKSEYMYDLMWV